MIKTFDASKYWYSDPLKIAKKIVRNYVDDYAGYTYAGYTINVVWFCYILGGWKALLCTNIPDQKYYEITYDKVKGEIYLDIYVKMDNIEIEVVND